MEKDTIKVLIIDDNVSLIQMVKEYFKDSSKIKVVLESYDGYFYIPESDLFSNYTSTIIEFDAGRYRFNHINQYYGTNAINANEKYEIPCEIYTDIDLNTINIYSMLTANGKTVINK